MSKTIDAMKKSKSTAASTFDRVATDLAHKAFPQLAAAIRASNDRILKQWRVVSVKAMPHLDELTLKEFEDSITEVLSTAADALQSADPQKLRGLMDKSPEHGVDRFVQKYSLLDLFEEVRILRAAVIIELDQEMKRPLDIGESETFHAIFDIFIQQGVMALVNAQTQELIKSQTTTAEMNERLLVASVRQHELVEEAKRAETEARESAEQLRLLKVSLEDQVELRTKELLAANEQLQGFTYSVAHDLRQQIRGISTNAGMLQADLGRHLDQNNQRTLERLQLKAQTLAELVDDLLTFARLGKQELRKRPLDLTNMAQDVATSVVERAACRQGTQFQISQGLESDGDALLMRIVFENLLENACKYSAEAETPVVEFGFEDGAFFVKDNGIGFDMQYVHKIFLPFERLHGDAVYAGTGIGLANVKRIVERHGGRIWAEARPGEGATFYFTLE